MYIDNVVELHFRFRNTCKISIFIENSLFFGIESEVLQNSVSLVLFSKLHSKNTQLEHFHNGMKFTFLVPQRGVSSEDDLVYSPVCVG